MTLRRVRVTRSLTVVLASAGAVASLGLLPGSAAQAYMRNRGNIPNTAPRGDAGFSESDINVIENLGERIPHGLSLQDGHGRKFEVDSLLGRGLPLLVTMGYYRCPQLCNLVHEGLAKGLKAAGLAPGRDFLGLSVSIDPKENAKSAVTNRNRLLRALGQSADETALGAQDPWPFLMPVPEQSASDQGPQAKLAQAVGFKYKFDAKSNQFAHAAVAFVLAPDGKISRYLYGVDFKPRDLRFALVEASGGRVGTTLDRILLTCFKYDPMTQSYSPFVFGFVRIGALLSGAALAGLLAVLWRREWLNRRRRLA
jgi:protein SCO1/2